jgi:N-acylneuraminate cytidylyltransferase
MTASVFAFIFARGGSKGLPRKNILPLGGKPLLAHAIHCARACRMVERIIVSTDDPEIAAVAREWGAEAPFLRPAELSTDSAPERLAWRHALQYVQDTEGRMPDVFVSVPATSPLRKPQDVEACIQKLLDTDADIIISVTPSSHSPYFNMVTLREGEAHRVIEPDQGSLHHRQEAPKIYNMTTVAYAARPRYIMEKASIFEGKVRAVEIPAGRALDIDTPLDWIIAEALLPHAESL